MSKAAVGFLIKQLHLEEPDIIAVGISPGLCDTKMVHGLINGGREFHVSSLSLFCWSGYSRLELLPAERQRRSYYVDTNGIFTDEGWGPADMEKYEKFVAQVEMITPAVAGNAYAQTVTKCDANISGLVLDYDDPRLPIAEHLKRDNVNQPIDYRKHSVETNGSSK